jgi:hypothetical protein
MSDKNPRLLSARWQIDEYIFIEYLQSDCILIDIGPFPHNPTDDETDQAFDYLQKAKLDYLNLGELEWTLDLARISKEFSILMSAGLSGELKHDPAFETASLPALIRFYRGRNQPEDDAYYLRVTFGLTGTKVAQEPTEISESVDDNEPQSKDWQPPKFIS